MSAKHAIRGAVAAVCLPVFLASAGHAQQDVFGEVIDVRVVNLEVVVTEKGHRVSGLGPEDFVLTVDGRQVPIEYFTEVLGGTAVLRDDETSGSTVPALAPGRVVGTSYLVFIDEFFSRLSDRNRVLRRLIEQLPLMRPEDRMAVVAYSGRRVEMLSTWSQSVESLTRVFEKARERPAFGLHRIAEERLFDSTRDLRLAGIDTSFSGFGTAFLDLDEQQRAEEISSQVERVILAASSALRSFANPPGRKVMLLLSGGWPNDPALWVVTDPTRAIYMSSVPQAGELWGPLVETANRLSYTLYPVDVPGVDATGFDVVDATVAEADVRRTRAFDRELDEETALNVIARRTGGRALLDSGGAEVFERVVEDTRTYYWLGFTPSWQGDNSAHDVRIRTRRDGLKIRSRRSFSDLSRETEVSMMVESSLLFGDLPSAAPLVAEVGEGERAGRGKKILPLAIRIPLDALTFLPQQDSFIAQTELRVAVLDDAGNTSEIPVIPLGIKTTGAPDEGDYTIYNTAIKVRKRRHDLIVSLYDKTSGAILSTKLEIDPR